MEKVQEVRFTRWDGIGETVEYRSGFGSGGQHPLADIDYSADGTTAAVTVFYPHKGTQRNYSEREVSKAEAIVDRHLGALGYSR